MTRRSLHHFAFFLGLTALPVPALGQESAVRARIGELYEALEASGDPTQVEQLSSAWRSRERGETRQLGEAWCILRRAVLRENASDFREARERFDWLVGGHPDWPWARFGLALAALHTYRAGFIIPVFYGNKVGGVHYQGFADQMEALLSREPTFAPAVSFLLEQLEAEPEYEVPRGLVELLARSAAAPGADPRLHFATARGFRIAQQLDAAMEELDLARESGVDPSLEHYERARTLAALGHLGEAEAHYATAADSPSVAARDRLRDDLAWIARPAELAAFDSASNVSVHKVVGEFWSKRDAIELRRPGERLREHLRRLAHAERYYRITFPMLRSNIKRVQLFDAGPCRVGNKLSLDDYEVRDPSRSTSWRKRERVYDHRAVVYIRHGEPMYRFADGLATDMADAPGFRGGRETERSVATRETDPPIARGPQMETVSSLAIWVYMFEGEIRVFRFQGSQYGYNQPTALTVNSIPTSPSALLALRPYMPDAMRLYSLITSPRLSQPLRCYGPVQSAVKEAQEDAAVAVRTDSYTRRFRVPLDAAVRVYTLGQPSLGTGVLLTVIGVPLDYALEPSRLDVAVADTITGAVTRGGGLLEPEQLTPARGNVAASALTMPLGVGRTSVRIALSDLGGERGLLAMAKVTPASAGFAMSDVVGGETDSPIAWERGGEKIRVNPLDRYATGGTVVLYYEVYGTTPGASYRTTVGLYPISNRKKVLAALSFTDVGANGDLRFQRELSLERIKQGDYRLVVTVTDERTGVVLRRERPVFVRQEVRSER